jgi:hypothetical protein
MSLNKLKKQLIMEANLIHKIMKNFYNKHKTKRYIMNNSNNNCLKIYWNWKINTIKYHNKNKNNHHKDRKFRNRYKN